MRRRVTRCLESSKHLQHLDVDITFQYLHPLLASVPLLVLDGADVVYVFIVWGLACPGKASVTAVTACMTVVTADRPGATSVNVFIQRWRLKLVLVTRHAAVIVIIIPSYSGILAFTKPIFSKISVVCCLEPAHCQLLRHLQTLTANSDCSPVQERSLKGRLLSGNVIELDGFHDNQSKNDLQIHFTKNIKTYIAKLFVFFLTLDFNVLTVLCIMYLHYSHC